MMRLVMGTLAKQQVGQQSASVAGGGGDLLGVLTPRLDRDGDGSAVNDILGTVGKMFGSR